MERRWLEGVRNVLQVSELKSKRKGIPGELAWKI